MQQTNKEKQHDNRRDNKEARAPEGSDRTLEKQNVGSNEDGFIGETVCITSRGVAPNPRKYLVTRIQEGESLEDALVRESYEADLRAEYMLEAMFDKELEEQDDDGY